MTNGHLDLIRRGARLADRLVVAVLRNEEKRPLFTVAERMEMIAEVAHPIANVEVDCFDGLLADYAARRGAGLILRGLRTASDFDDEWRMALMNRRLRPELETVFLAADEAHSFVSSRLVKEVARLGGDISGLVPPAVEARLRIKLSGGSS